MYGQLQTNNCGLGLSLYPAEHPHFHSFALNASSQRPYWMYLCSLTPPSNLPHFHAYSHLHVLSGTTLEALSAQSPIWLRSPAGRESAKQISLPSCISTLPHFHTHIHTFPQGPRWRRSRPSLPSGSGARRAGRGPRRHAEPSLQPQLGQGIGMGLRRLQQQRQNLGLPGLQGRRRKQHRREGQTAVEAMAGAAQTAR